jgi:hypothetical protein
MHEQHGVSELFVTHLLSRNIRYEADLVGSLVQLHREAFGPNAFVAGSFWQGKPNQYFPESTRNTWHRWSARPGRESVIS